MKNRPLILVTNDDGIHYKGIDALIEAVQPFGDLVVVAPDVGNSAKSHAVTVDKPLFINILAEQDGLIKYSCTGTPVDCVKIAINQVLKRKPDFLVSGINHGPNSSINVIYSGTMAAAIEGCMSGIPSIGFSINDYSVDLDFSAAKVYAAKIFRKIMETGLPEGTCLNINIPHLKEDKINGIKICRQARGAWNEEFEKRTHPGGRSYYWLTGHFTNFEENANDTDLWALNNNFVSIVPTLVDFTDFNAINFLKSKNYDK